MYKKILESRQMGKQTFNQTKKILGIVLVVFFVAALTAPAISADETHHSNKGLQTFNTEQLAKQHCPTDTVVWLNLRSGVYHYKGQRWYGNTKSGAYVCQKEADQTGDRATRGQ
jgi:hypothetical protein